MVPYDKIDQIIEDYLKPRITLECRRLGIPPSYILGIYSIFPKAFAYSSRCDPVEEKGEIKGVMIRIDSSITKPNAALCAFWHEMRHAKDYYKNRKPKETIANLYAWKRYCQYLIHREI